MLDRRIENELVPLCQKYELAIIPWSPLVMGILAGRYPEAVNYPEDSRAHLWDNNMVRTRITQRSIGPRTLAHLEDALGILDKTLNEADRPLFDELVHPGTVRYPISIIQTIG